jgi:redox-sensitive bicupin YhaK (pirin superfamily)
MLTLHRSDERGYFEIDWLKSYHSFSFGEYYDPKHMNFRSLRVLNHDLIAPNSGFPLHAHRDMEIITYVLKGAVEHKDSLGNQEQILAGEVQVMSAGQGVRHSEYNPNPNQELELLQIWVLPERANLEPSYQQKVFSREEKLNQWRLIASRDAAGVLKIHQDVELYATILEPGRELAYDIKSGRGIWIQVARGEAEVNGKKVRGGDALAFESEAKVEVKASTEAELLLFDLG